MPVASEGHTKASHEGNRPQPGGHWGVGAGGQEAVSPLLEGPLPKRQALSRVPEEMALPIRAIAYTEHFCGFCLKGVGGMSFLDRPKT